MNFGKFDIVLLITMVIAIVSMSFVFPALGLTEADTDENDIPEFEMESERFDFVDEFPEQPDIGDEGELYVNNSDDTHTENNVSFGDVELSIQAENDTGEGTIEDPITVVDLVDFSGSEPYEADTHEFGSNPSVGDTAELSQSGFAVDVEIIEVNNLGESDYSWAIEYELTEEENNWFVEDVADGLSHIVRILIWGVGTAFQTAINTIGILFDAVTFQFELLNWLTTTYGEVISSANGWASIFVAIPGILLAIELAKITLVAISLLPTT